MRTSWSTIKNSARRERKLIAAVFAVLVLASSGCIPSGPTYPFDIFPEMHYSASIRPQEPPRLDPPPDAVPITGRSFSIGLAQLAEMENPVVSNPENIERAAELYRINCRACHGPEGRGNGFVGIYYRPANLPPPADFASETVQQLTDGQIYGSIANGIRGMPPWRNLLATEDIWLLVLFVRSVGESQ